MDTSFSETSCPQGSETLSNSTTNQGASAQICEPEEVISQQTNALPVCKLGGKA